MLQKKEEQMFTHIQQSYGSGQNPFTPQRDSTVHEPQEGNRKAPAHIFEQQ